VIWMQRRLARLRRDEGASAVEYGLLVAAIAAIVVTVVFAIGRFVQAGFNDTCTRIDAQTTAECDPAP
jgi:pilus assembly protein Flp/PilA